MTDAAYIATATDASVATNQPFLPPLPIINKTAAEDDVVGPLHVLMCVRIVTRERPQVAALLHVNLLIDAFLYRPQYFHKSLEDAMADDNVHLLRRLLADVSYHADARGTTAAVQHPFFVGLQVTKAARLAVQQRSSLRNFQQLLSCLHAVDSEAVGVSGVVEEAAAVGDLELLQWLHTSCPLDSVSVIVDSNQAAARAGGNGHVHVLEWLVASSWWSPQSRLPLGEAVKNNHHEVLEWLDDCEAGRLFEQPSVSLSITPGAFRDAAGRGDLAMLAWLFKHHDPERDEPVTHHAADGAAAGGHVNALEWLYECHQEEAQCDLNGYVEAARNGHLAVLQWLYARHPKRFWIESMEEAAQAAHLEVVQFLHEKREEGDTIGFRASTANRLDVIQFLFEHYPLESYIVVQIAAANGSLDIIQWLQENHDEVVTSPNVINLAVSNEQIHVLEFIFRHVHGQELTQFICSAADADNMRVMQWLHVKLLELSPTVVNPRQGLARWGHSTIGPSFPMNYAAKNGNLEMIQWLEAHDYGECSTLAMEWAAEKGHLHVLQYLHETRGKGCTTSAMDLAAANGKLKVVQWLNAHRNEGCTTDAVDLAVRNGHPKVVEFLLTNRSEGCTRAAVQSAIEVRHDAEMVHLLFVLRREMVDVEAVRAHADGNETMLRWLRRVDDSTQAF